MKILSVWLIVPLVVVWGCSSNYATQSPPPGSLRPGEVVLVDDGTCPPGKIKRIVGADQQRGQPRRVRCVRR